MSLLGVIERFRTAGTGANGQYVVTRTAAGDYAATGDYAPGSTSTLLITASVQPLDGRENVVLPEGVRVEDVRQIFTATELRVADGLVDEDVVTIPCPDGASPFHVFKVDGPWTLRSTTSYRALAARRRSP